MDRDSEREAIAKTVESLERTTGQRTVGWFTRYGPSVNTRDLVVEHGGFIYDSIGMNDDLPYYSLSKTGLGWWSLTVWRPTTPGSGGVASSASTTSTNT